HEAIAQVSQKAIGLNIGGKIGIARYHDHVAVAIFVGIGLLHLNEIALGLGHRVI
ncbi:MAG: hut operon positive regulator HutP, partial [Clostridiales bacterium]|nr:hut operon positive regulator HutP [Clostridiales bacterium]